MKHSCIAVVVLIAFLPIWALPANAQNQDDIIISADGSVLSAAPALLPPALLQTDNTYTLTTNTTGMIIVNASNIVLDGTGHEVQSIFLHGTTNVTVKNFIINCPHEQGRYYRYGVIGIALENATNSVVKNNTVTGFASIHGISGTLFAGIHLIGGSANTITYILNSRKFFNLQAGVG